MLLTVTHLTVIVENQDEALDFYTNKLGFVVNTDAPFEDFRFITVNPEGNPSFEIALLPAQTEEDMALVGQQSGNYPLCVILTDNCKKTAEEMKQRGVEFIREPEEQPWGTQALFVDLYGNVFNLCEVPLADE